MSQTISIGQLRQNPTAMIRDVRAGASYTVTDHGEPVADVVPHRTGRITRWGDASAVLAAMGPDERWAEELRRNRAEPELTDPWVDER
jgi:prevent-host-death family protein